MSGFYPTRSVTSRANTPAVDFRAGTYVLVDTSSNGTYVNGAQVPLGKYHDYQLKEGDYVRLGEYELLVSIDKSNDFPPEESAIVAYDGQSPSSAVKKSTANDLGADLDLSQLLEPSDLSPRRLRRAAPRRLRPSPAREPSRSPRCLAPSASELEDRRRRHPLAHDDAAAQGRRPQCRSRQRAPRPTRRTAAARPQSPVLYDGDFDVGLSAFCRGAGIDPRNIAPEARGAGAAARRPIAARIGVGLDGPESGPQRIPQSLPHFPAAPMTDPNRR